MTGARSRIWYFRTLHRKPVGIERLLFLKVAFEGVGNVLKREGANSTAGYAVWRSREGAVNELGGRVAIQAFDQIGGRF